MDMAVQCGKLLQFSTFLILSWSGCVHRWKDRQDFVSPLGTTSHVVSLLTGTSLVIGALTIPLLTITYRKLSGRNQGPTRSDKERDTATSTSDTKEIFPVESFLPNNACNTKTALKKREKEKKKRKASDLGDTKAIVNEPKQEANKVITSNLPSKRCTQKEVPVEPSILVQKEALLEPCHIPLSPVVSTKNTTSNLPSKSCTQKEVPVEPSILVQKKAPIEPCPIPLSHVVSTKNNISNLPSKSCTKKEAPVEPSIFIQKEVPIEPCHIPLPSMVSTKSPTKQATKASQCIPEIVEKPRIDITVINTVDSRTTKRTIASKEHLLRKSLKTTRSLSTGSISSAKGLLSDSLETKLSNRLNPVPSKCMVSHIAPRLNVRRARSSIDDFSYFTTESFGSPRFQSCTLANNNSNAIGHKLTVVPAISLPRVTNSSTQSTSFRISNPLIKSHSASLYRVYNLFDNRGPSLFASPPSLENK